MKKVIGVVLKDKTILTGYKIRFSKKQNLAVVTDIEEQKTVHPDKESTITKVTHYYYIPGENINFWSILENE